MTFDVATARPAQRQDCALIDASVRNMDASWWVETRVSPRPRARLDAILGSVARAAQANSARLAAAASLSFRARNAALARRYWNATSAKLRSFLLCS